MINPKISVIMPTINLTLAEKPSIDSILNQTYKNLELVIVVDGGLHSWTPQDKRVKLIKKDANVGIWAATNLGYEQATSNLITAHDNDDLSYNKRFELLLSVFNPDIGVVGSDLWLVDASKKRNRPMEFNTSKWFRKCLHKSLIVPPIHHCCCLMNRTWWNELGTYRDEFKYTADSRRMIKLGLMLQFKGAYIPSLPFCLYTYIKSRLSFSSINKEATKLENKTTRAKIWSQLNSLKSFTYEDVSKL